MISDWLESAEETAVLILVSDEISVDAKLTKLVPASNKKQFWEMFEDKKLPWIYNFIKKNGYEIEQDAAECILQMIENNTLALKQECSRFFMCFAKGHRITIEDVESVLSHNREENAFTLFNHMADSTQAQQKRLENSLNILQSIRLSKDSSSVKIIAGLSSCFRKLATWISINDDGYVDEQVLRQNGFSSKLQQKQYRSAAKLWTIGQTTAILAILAATDMEIRSNGSLMEDVLLQKMIYEIVIKKGATISSAEY
jgi:DNA polymerase-3 subunit delta